MKILVNIVLLAILLGLLAAAIFVPQTWKADKRAERGSPETSQSLLLQADESTAQSPEKPKAGPVAEPPAEPILAPPVDPVLETIAEPPDEPIETTPEPSVVSPKQILEILAKLQRGESDDAAILVNEALETLDDEDAIALQSIVTTESARAGQIESLSTELAESREELSTLQRTSQKELKESLRTLSKATERADKAAAEAKKKSEELERVKREHLTATKKSAEQPPKPPEKQLKLPENDLVDFAFGSTYLSADNKVTLTKTIKLLKERNDLVLQLRGHTDTIGNPEYNATLANARCEMARDFLIENGIENSRISIVSFGESQVFKDGVVAEKPRRVEIVFRRKS